MRLRQGKKGEVAAGLGEGQELLTCLAGGSTTFVASSASPKIKEVEG